MFRFTIRELLLLTACVALGAGWWLDHRQKAEAAEDARMLAHFSVTERWMMCSQEAGWFARLQEKYRAKPTMFVISAEDEEKLGIDFEEP